MLLVLERLCGDVKLPINAMEYAERIEQELDNLEMVYGPQMGDHGMNFVTIKEHAESFRYAAEQLHAALDATNQNDARQLR